MRTFINATQHPQRSEQWAEFGIRFDRPDFAPFSSVSPKSSIREQAVMAWRKAMGEYTRHFDSDITCDGFLLGGYAPLVVSLYQLASQFRVPTFSAVMGPAPLVDGQRRGFVLAGYRRIPSPKKLRSETPREGQPLPPASLEEIEAEEAIAADLMPESEIRYFMLPQGHEVKNHDRFVHLSSRPLTEARRAELATVCPQRLISVPPVNPPPAGSCERSFQDSINEIAEVAISESCAILSDGAAAETLLRLYALLGHCVPFHYVATEITPATVAGGAPTHKVVGVSKIPRF
jgi:hypothetical protein